MKFSAFTLTLALLLLAGFAAPMAAEAPAVDLPSAETPAQEAPAEVAPEAAATAGDLLGLDTPLKAPETQELSCRYTCPNGNPFLCPAYPDRPFPSCVGGCCVYI